MCFRESGTVNTAVKVPDTITTWDADAFCLSSEGFGLAPGLQFTVFQPFFLELILPYSIIRGEQFQLKATVFSYLTKCIMVRCFLLFSSRQTIPDTTVCTADVQTCGAVLQRAFSSASSVSFQLTVTPDVSADYKLVPLSGDQYTSCLCGGERKTVSWNMIPSTIGEAGGPVPSLPAVHPAADAN